MASKILIQSDAYSASFSLKECIRSVFDKKAAHRLSAITSYQLQKVNAQLFKISCCLDLTHPSIHVLKERLAGVAFRNDIGFEVMIACAPKAEREEFPRYTLVAHHQEKELSSFLGKFFSHEILTRYQGFMMEALVKKSIEDYCSTRTQFLNTITFEQVFYTAQTQDVNEKIDLQVVFLTASKKDVFKFGVKSSLKGVFASRDRTKVPQLGVVSFEITNYQIAEAVAKLLILNRTDPTSVIITSKKIIEVALSAVKAS